MATLLCIGFGYCAQHYVAEFGARFSRIVGTTRSAESAAAMRARECGGRKIETLVFDGKQALPELIAAIAEADALLLSAAPDERGDPALIALGDTLTKATRLRAIVYLSTIGVYGDRGGDWVDEGAEPRPLSARSRERVEAERAWQARGARRGIPVAILRLAGIYGPGRNALVNVAGGHARRIDKPGQVFNRIHVADIAQAIEAAFARGANGIFNLADDEPTPPGTPIAFAADLLGIAPPPEIPFEQAAKTMTPMALSFYGESKRVRNDRLKSMLGVRLRYPSYREGLGALHAGGDGGDAKG
jgi:nucleoside-diphosphate-sugar epimerase